MEGQGVLMHHADENAEQQAVIDIGERTTDLVAIDSAGSPLRKLCGGTELGVGQVVDGLREAIRGNFGRLITTGLAHKVLRAYAHNETLPVIKVNNAAIPADYITSIIDQSLERVGRSINIFISQKWNVES